MNKLKKLIYLIIKYKNICDTCKIKNLNVNVINKGIDYQYECECQI